MPAPSPQRLARLRVLTILLWGALLLGCAGTPVERAAPVSATPTASPLDPQSVRGRLLHHALDLRGTPYRYGGSDRHGLDCSGFVHLAYGEAGIRVPRTVAALRRAARPVATTALQPGDLVFFSVLPAKGSEHVGIYLGDGRFVHAPSSGGRVHVSDLGNPYWRRHLAGGGRLLPAGSN